VKVARTYKAQRIPAPEGERSLPLPREKWKVSRGSPNVARVKVLKKKNLLPSEDVPEREGGMTPSHRRRRFSSAG